VIPTPDWPTESTAVEAREPHIHTRIVGLLRFLGLHGQLGLGLTWTIQPPSGKGASVTRFPVILIMA